MSVDLKLDLITDLPATSAAEREMSQIRKRSDKEIDLPATAAADVRFHIEIVVDTPDQVGSLAQRILDSGFTYLNITRYSQTKIGMTVGAAELGQLVVMFSGGQIGTVQVNGSYTR